VGGGGRVALLELFEWLVVGGSALYCSVLCICNNMTRCLNVDGFGG